MSRNWIEELRTDPARREEAARDFLLQSLRVAIDTANYGILRTVRSRESATVDELVLESGLGTAVVQERLRELQGVGLVSRAVEDGTVRATELTTGLLGFFEDVQRRVSEKMVGNLPALLGGGS